MTKIGNADSAATRMSAKPATRSPSPSKADRVAGTHAGAALVVAQGAVAAGAEASLAPEVVAAVQGLQGTGDALYLAAFRILLRQRLTKELGLIVSTDHSTAALLDEVMQRMENDKELYSCILQAGRALIDGSRERR